MPIVSQFYGIIIRIFFKDTEKHHLDHIHAQYNEFDAVYSISQLKVIDGGLPSKQHNLVIAWMEIHQEELLALWRVAQSDGDFFKIDPLK